MNMTWSYDEKNVIVEILTNGMLNKGIEEKLCDAKFDYKGGKFIKANNRKNRLTAKELTEAFNKLPESWNRW